MMRTLISIDNGGTLTDAIAVRAGQFYRSKALTTPHDLSECFIRSIEALSCEIFGAEDTARLLAESDLIRYSTTQGTNALVQARDKGPRIGLIVSAGTDEQQFCNTSAERALFASLVGGRLVQAPADLSEPSVDRKIIALINELSMSGANRLVVCLRGAQAQAQERELRNRLLRLFPRHFLGALPVLLAHELVAGDGHTQGGWSAILNAFLHPSMEHFLYNAERHLRDAHVRYPLQIFRNDGKSTRVARTVALKTYSSGPRGGMEGAKAYADHYAIGQLLTLDIGGTTTDIGVIRGGEIVESANGQVEGVEVGLTMSDIASPGIGGSSILSYRNAMIKVGPESVGAAPGPACFGYGGSDPTITDVYLARGYFDPATFFGGRLTIDKDKAIAAINDKIASPAGLDCDTALIELDSAYQQTISAQLGSRVDLADSDTALLAFGGAGAMSACKVAQSIGIKRVIVPHASSVFCAYGLGFSDVCYEATAALSEAESTPIELLSARVERELFAEGFTAEECDFSRYWLVKDSDGEQRVDATEAPQPAAATHARVIARKQLAKFPLRELNVAGTAAQPASSRSCLLDNGETAEVPVYDSPALPCGAGGSGPALIEDAYSTLWVSEGWNFELNGNRDVVLTHCSGESP